MQEDEKTLLKSNWPDIGIGDPTAYEKPTFRVYEGDILLYASKKPERVQAFLSNRKNSNMKVIVFSAEETYELNRKNRENYVWNAGTAHVQHDQEKRRTDIDNH